MVDLSLDREVLPEAVEQISEACTAAGAGRLWAADLAGERAAHLHGSLGGPVELPVPFQSSVASCLEEAHPGARRNPCALRLSPDPL